MALIPSFRLVTEPGEEPISLAEAKLHCRVEAAEDDALIAGQIVAARRWAEQQTNRALVTQTWRMKLDAFPSDRDYITIPRGPLASVTSIVYVDEAGASQTWASSNYVVSADADPGRIVLAYDKKWPTTRDQPEAVTITVVLGYGGRESVPADIKAAMLLQVGDLYAHRERTAAGVTLARSPAADDLLGPYKLMIL